MALEVALPWITLFYLSGTIVITLVMTFLTYLGSKPYLKYWTAYWGLLGIGYVVLYFGLIYEGERLIRLYLWLVVVGSIVFFRASCLMRAIVYTHFRLLIHTLIAIIAFIAVWLNVSDGFATLIFLVIPSVLYISGGIMVMTVKGLLYRLAGLFGVLIGVNYFGYPYLVEIPAYTPTGHLITAIIAMIFGVSILGIYFVEVSNDQKRLREKLFYMSFHDRLTGLHNRAYFDERLERIHEENIYPMAMIVLDLNNLKTVNDTYGHRYGDDMLIETASLLQSLTEENRIITRYGGDEFVILLLNEDIKVAQELGNQIKVKAEAIAIQGVPLEMAIGTAEKREKTEPIDKLFDRAEAKMYEEKQQ